MNTTHVTPTGIAIALATALALGLLFFGPRLFSSPKLTETTPVATSTVSTLQATTTTMNEQSNAYPAAASGAPAKVIPAQVRADGLEITDVQLGTGKVATAGSHVSMNYVGMLTNGTVFDASAKRNQSFDFDLGVGQVIKGWDEGIVGMKEGGKRHLVIPAALAYGNQSIGNGLIPANSTLIFDVELLKVQ